MRVTGLVTWADCITPFPMDACASTEFISKDYLFAHTIRQTTDNRQPISHGLLRLTGDTTDHT